MNKKILPIIAVIVVALVVAVAFGSGFMNNIGKGTIQIFGYETSVTGSTASTSIMPYVNNTGNSTSNATGLTFSVLASNPTVINPQNMSQAGWSGWHITSQLITVYSAINAVNGTPNVVAFVQIQNSLSVNVSLNVNATLIGGRIASYVLQNGTAINAGFIVAVMNGTNYTTTTTNNATNQVVVGYGSMINGTTTVTMQPSEYFDLYLSTVPNVTVNPHNQIVNDGMFTYGVVNIGV